MTHEPDSDASGSLADSAGIPWQGRSFEQHSNAFANDDGSMPEALGAVLASFRSGKVSRDAVLDAFLRSRLLIPLVTVAGEEGLTPEGRRVDKTQELSIVTVKVPDGRSALPVFSSVEAMQRWNALARPIPNLGHTVIHAAVEEGSDLVILDPASAETEFAIRRPALWALAQGESVSVPWSDPEVEHAFRESVETSPEVASISLESGDPTERLLAPELSVFLTLRPGLSQQQLSALLGRLQAQWAESAVIAERVDSMSVKLRPSEPASS